MIWPTISTYGIWAAWALLLVAQNFALTFVSRARSSASIKRHAIASLCSNGIWFASQTIIFGKMLDLFRTAHSALYWIWLVTFYTTFTIAGSLTAHYWALKTEKGKTSVGASNKYVQITPEAWERIRGAILPIALRIGDLEKALGVKSRYARAENPFIDRPGGSSEVSSAGRELSPSHVGLERLQERS